MSGQTAPLSGIPASHGIGIGTAILLRPQSLTYEPHPVEDKAAEKQRLQAAISRFIQDTQAVADTFGQRLDARDAEILTGHIDMIQDPFLQEEMNNRIDEGQCAEAAAEAVLEMFKALFQSSEVELIQQRATDVEDIRQKLLEILLGVEQLDLKHLPQNSVLVVDDLTPSMTAEMDHDSVVGIVTQRGGITSHSAILSRALGIPAVLSVPDVLEAVQEGAAVIVDGTKGTVLVEPDEATLEQYQTYQASAAAKKQQLEQFRGRPTQTRDGKPMQVLANIGTPPEAAQVTQQDGEGVGLFRTEFLYMNRTEAPDEATQYQAYRQVCEELGGKPVIIRTLDVGGDKDIPYLHLEPEDNPFLGCRAVRYCLRNPDTFRTQLTALMRAHPDGRLRFEDICRASGWGQTALKECFRRYQHMSVMACYRRIRIEEARRLLREGRLNVSQVAETLGYSSVQYFSAQFRREMGMSPMQYLRTVRG